MGDKPVKQKNNKRFIPTRTFADRPEDINRKGRPKKEHSLTDLLREALEQPHDETGITKKQTVIDTLYEIAVTKKDVVMLKYLFDRIDGKPLQTIENTNFNYDENDMSDYTDDELRKLKEIHKKHESI